MNNNPLFDDSEATEAEIKRARRLIARVELEESAKARHKMYKDMQSKDEQHAADVWRSIHLLDMRIVRLVLEVFPDESEQK